MDASHYKLRTDQSYQYVALKFSIHEPSIVSNGMRVWKKERIDGFSKPKGRPTISNKPKNQNRKNQKLTREQELERENELLRVEKHSLPLN